MRAEERIICQSCGAECYARERVCWKCGASLNAPPPPQAVSPEPLLNPEPAPIVMRLTFCKVCGQQNDEEAVECRKCGKPLEVVPLGSVPEVKPLPRSWGFDVLGLIWIALGLAALFAGEFLIKTDPKQPYASIGDYMWTLVVVSIPGILVILRLPPCRILFHVMTVMAFIFWLEPGIIWFIVAAYHNTNLQKALFWIAILSVLSIVSFYTVRQNDEFD